MSTKWIVNPENQIKKKLNNLLMHRKREKCFCDRLFLTFEDTRDDKKTLRGSFMSLFDEPSENLKREVGKIK